MGEYKKLYQEWPTTPEHSGCMSPDYAAFCDWLELWIEDEHKKDTAEAQRVEKIDKVTLWKLVQDASEYCKTPAMLAALNDAVMRSPYDVSPCLACGELVVCVPDGMPMCESCGKDGDDGR